MDWAYPYETKNAFEKRAELLDVSQQRVSSLPSSRQIEKTLEPQFLCFLNKNGFADLLELSVWRKRMGCQPDTRVEYVVVSFTTQQFNERNRPYLHQVGVHAARAAGVNAYWVSTSCLGRDKKERENNVWRICDIVRSAHSLVVAVSGSAATEVLMREWSMRVWTWPEILLSPGRGDIYIYRRDDSLDSLDNPIPWAKRNFAIIWDDAALSGQLLDHYEGSVILTPLELVTLALQCLSNRATIQYLEGDLSYSLMGLLRQRPAIVAKDNAFQAFARLSLANDSNMLLERLICLLPRSPNEPWHSLSDKWDASLWDIYPTTQVCGMGEHDTVIIDGVRGAAIRWNSFTPVFTLIRETMLRHIIRWILRTVPFLVLAGLLWVITAGAFQSRLLAAGLVKIGAVFMGLALTVMLSSPILIRAIYRGKVWDVQPWFFGVEGHMSLPDLELHIFGSYEGKLKWSAFGSPLSRHAAEKNKGFEHFCEGQDPSQYDEVKKRIDAVQSSDHGDRVFTLVDTHTMTVTLFSATRPPVAVLLCGREGGMQRALLCSYDWRTSSLYRETVLRMETRVSDKMQYMPRVRLGLRRKQKDGSF
ncbi:hypothetical protein MMC30_006291 [Trapelia coarctata]|nr:hypothetical protein [Trapelia coarctata]